MEVTECRELIEKRTTFEFIEKLEKKLEKKEKKNNQDHQVIHDTINEINKQMKEDVYLAVKRANKTIQQGYEKIMEKRATGATIDTYE
jgi:hypothetical protein